MDDLEAGRIDRKGHIDHIEILFCDLCTAMHKSLRTLRKFSGGRGYPKRGFARAKTPRTPSPEV
jgi:hypothetical protein